METWFIILISISISLLLKPIFSLFISPIITKKPSHPLPPGPSTFPIIGNIIWLKKNSFSDFQHILRQLHATLGPIFTIHIGSRPAIWVADRSLAHQALVEHGAVFADRAPALPTTKITTSNQHDIHSAFYGPTWRLLRRNLTAEMLHPSRVNSYSNARKWVLQILIECLNSEQAEFGHVFRVLNHVRYAMFCLLALMCFGEKLSEKEIKEIEDAQYRLLLSYRRFAILNFWPRVTKLLLRKRWEEFFQLRKNQENVLIPLIRARKKLKEENKISTSSTKVEYSVLSYVDTLLDLELPEEKRKLDEGEMVSLCSEFLNAGTDPTATAMQWIVANLVKYPNIQEKLFMEIKGVVGDQEEVKEDDLHKLTHLKAVILEGLRRHPPGHFLSPHRVSEDTVLGGFSVPRNGTINFMVAEMGRDPKVWEDPMAFKPERFLNDDGNLEGIDITGNKEIKVMPFGAGRRICPGHGVAMLHLEYFVANLVWKFEWKAVDGEDVELSEKQEFITMVMKNPVRANIYPRKR